MKVNWKCHFRDFAFLAVIAMLAHTKISGAWVLCMIVAAIYHYYGYRDGLRHGIEDATQIKSESEK